MKYLRNVSFLFLLLLIAACSSMPAPEGADATLLLIDRGMDMQGSATDKFYKAVINLSGGAEPITVTMSTQPMMLTELPPGRYTVESITLRHVEPPGWKNEQPVPDRTLDLGEEFEMRAGYITVFPRKFVQYGKKSVANSISIGFRLESVDPRAALANVSWMDEFALWKNDYGVDPAK